jgi:DNA-binding MarR family transcriptional regulator
LRKGCIYATIVVVEPATATREKKTVVEATPEIRATAARIAALVSHIFLFDQGQQLRTIEESGLTMAQCKTLLALAGPGESAEPRQITEIAERLGLSLPSMSRAVDGLTRKHLVTRVEDEHDRRVKRIAIASKGEKLVSELVSMRLAGLEAFASTLNAAQRRKLDAAIDGLDREEIAATYEQLIEKGNGR